MASDLMVGFLTGLGTGAWVYNKSYKSNGGNTKNSLILGASAALGTLILVTTLLGIFWKK